MSSVVAEEAFLSWLASDGKVAASTHKQALSALLYLPDSLTVAAHLHDNQLHNDHRDPQYERRAADFALRLRRERVINELADHELKHVCETMRLNSYGHTTGEPVILACWDADRLDLARVGIEPKPSRLCTEQARPASTIEMAVRRSVGVRRATSSTQK